MKKLSRGFIALATVLTALFFLGAFPALAAESPVMNVMVTNNTTGTKQTVALHTTPQALTRGEGEVFQGEAYVKIPMNGTDPVEIMDATGYASTIDSSSSQNVYWKATVSITFTQDDTYCTFSKAGASWTQLRGNSTLSDREMYWGYTLGVSSGGKTNYPSSNSVSYNTGLDAKKYGGGSIIGCNSSVLITLDSGITITLEANILKDL